MDKNMNGYTELDALRRNGSSRSATVRWKNVNVYTKDKKNGEGRTNLKRIINNASGFIEPGTLMAVMGSRFIHDFNLFLVETDLVSCSCESLLYI